MPCVTRLRRICNKNRSGILPASASLLHGTGVVGSLLASCNVACTAYPTVRDNFMIACPLSSEVHLKAADEWMSWRDNSKKCFRDSPLLGTGRYPSPAG